MKFEPLSREHDRAEFVSGQSAADGFLRAKALNHQKLGVSKTFVWCPNDDGAIGAFYTLSYVTLQREDLPKPGKFPRYPLPACKLGWLAVDDRLQGRGLGSDALVVALRHGYNWMSKTAGVAVVLDALDRRAYDWYLTKEFMRPIPGSELALFVDLKSLEAL